MKEQIIRSAPAGAHGRARFVLSLDTEIAWGTFDKQGFVTYKYHLDNYRPLIDRLIRLLEQYSIKATWAFVGHLFLDKCDGLHQDVLTPKYSWFNNENWHKYDPGTDLEKDPYWYGKDILQKVLGMKTKQEIGTHTFSHVIIGDKECTAEIAKSQIMSCIKLGKQSGVEIKSLVFPRNKIGFLEEIASCGIKTFRGIERKWYARKPAWLQPFLFASDCLMGIAPPVYRMEELSYQYDMLEIPASQFLTRYDGIRKFIPSWSRIIKARRGMKNAIKHNAIYHLWFHPFNLGSSEKMFSALEEILKYFSEERARGSIENSTMIEIYNAYKNGY